MVEEKKLTVLVVDDEEVVRIAIAELICKDYKVIVAANGQEAIDKVKEHKIDLMLLDLLMPGIHGIDVVKEVKKINNEIDIIVLTALDEAKMAWQAQEIGACDYITKPYQNDELLFRLKKAADSYLKMQETKKEMNLMVRIMRKGYDIEPGDKEKWLELQKFVEKRLKEENTLPTGEEIMEFLGGEDVFGLDLG